MGWVGAGVRKVLFLFCYMLVAWVAALRSFSQASFMRRSVFNMYGMRFLFLLLYIPNVKERVGVENFGDCLSHSSDKQLPSASA